MFTYIKIVTWWCEWCWGEQEFHYGRQPRFCSNVCKYRARDEAWYKEQQEKLKKLRGWRNGSRARSRA